MELKRGYKQTELGLIPEDWEILPIDKIFSFYSTSNYSKAQMDFDGDVGCIHYGLIHAIPNSIYDVKKGIKYYVTKEQASYETIKNGDIVMVDASEDLEGVNKSIELFGIEDELFIAGLHTYLLRDSNSKLANRFRGAILNSSTIKSQFNKLAVGMKVFGVSKPQLRTVLIPVPAKAEQTAIATALSDMDNLIAGLEKQIEKKKAIKQGAMQELLRPKEGWVLDSPLGNILYVQGGYAFKSGLFKDIGIPIIRISDVGDGVVWLLNCVKYDDISLPEAFSASKGDVLIAMSGATTGKIGIYTESKSAYINQRVGKFCVLDKRKNSLQFVSHLVQGHKFRVGLLKELAQGAQPNISGKQIESIVVDYPFSIEEQNEIATTLSDIENEIILMEKNLFKYHLLKDGMMQELLTGKTRLV